MKKMSKHTSAKNKKRRSKHGLTLHQTGQWCKKIKVIRRFMWHFDGLELPCSMLIKGLVKNIELFKKLNRLSEENVRNMTEHREHIIERTFEGRILYSQNLKKCLSKVVRYYSSKTGQSINTEQARANIRKLGFEAVFIDNRWELKLDNIVKRYAHSWDANKRSFHPVFSPEVFDYSLRLVRPEDLKWSRQRITMEEVEFLLFKLTRKLYTENRAERIPHNYLLAASKEYEKKTKRKLGADKIGYIAKLLTKYGFIQYERGYNRPSIYAIGENNPYFEKTQATRLY